jgi:monolysocardiolipin acyltransferase
MRYFKWGVARLILESEPCPDVLPMWIDGPQEVMDNERPFPKPVPRAGKDIKVTFGDLVDREAVFGKFRERWRELKERAKRNKLGAVDDGVQAEELGVLVDHELKFGKEAEQLRIEVTLAVRDQVLKVRRACGLEDEDPKRGLADSYREEDGAFGRDGLKKDGSTTKGV